MRVLVRRHQPREGSVMTSRRSLCAKARVLIAVLWDLQGDARREGALMKCFYFRAAENAIVESILAYESPEVIAIHIDRAQRMIDEGAERWIP